MASFQSLNVDETGQVGATADAVADPTYQPPALSRPSVLRKLLLAACVTILVLFIGLVVLGTKSSDGGSSGAPSPTPDPDPASSLAGNIHGANMFHTLEGLFGVAMAHNGTRSMLLGANASVDYMQKRIMDETPYTTSVETFTVSHAYLEGSVLKQVKPNAKEYIWALDYTVRQGAGDVTGDLVYLADGGCDTSKLTPGTNQIAIMTGMNRACGGMATQRKAVEDAGAAAILYYYPNEKLIQMGVQLPGEHSIPTFFVSPSLGDELIAQVEAGDTVNMQMTSNLKFSEIITRNLIVETDAGDPDTVVTIGSHIDSVAAGPGMNDDGSGSAANLELILQFHKIASRVKNRVRFCFFGAEEEGLLGSFAYVKSLTEKNNMTHALDQVVVNIDIDMLASPNMVRFVYNASSGAAPPATWKGNIYLQHLFTDYFDSRSLDYDFDDFDGRSDYEAFLEGNIPAGGITTGAEVIKTMDQRKRFGGFANAPFDPCYHQACDTLENINVPALEELARSAAYAIETMATEPDLRTKLGRPKNF